jgi:hypothetical protein
MCGGLMSPTSKRGDFITASRIGQAIEEMRVLKLADRDKIRE